MVYFSKHWSSSGGALRSNRRDSKTTFPGKIPRLENSSLICNETSSVIDDLVRIEVYCVYQCV